MTSTSCATSTPDDVYAEFEARARRARRSARAARQAGLLVLQSANAPLAFRVPAAALGDRGHAHHH